MMMFHSKKLIQLVERCGKQPDVFTYGTSKDVVILRGRKQLAKHFGFSEHTIKRWFQKNKTKEGKPDIKKIQEFLENKTPRRPKTTKQKRQPLKRAKKKMAKKLPPKEALELNISLIKKQAPEWCKFVGVA